MNRHLADRVFVASAIGYAASWCLPAGSSGTLPTGHVNGLAAALSCFEPIPGLDVLFKMLFVRAGVFALTAIGIGLVFFESIRLWETEAAEPRQRMARFLPMLFLLSAFVGCSLFNPRIGFALWIVSLLGMSYSFGLRRDLDLVAELKARFQTKQIHRILEEPIQESDAEDELEFTPISLPVRLALPVVFVGCALYAGATARDIADIPRVRSTAQLVPPIPWGVASGLNTLDLRLDGNANLLLRGRREEDDGFPRPVARYDFSSGELSQVAEEEWTRQTTTVLDCSRPTLNRFQNKTIPSLPAEAESSPEYPDGFRVPLHARYGLYSGVSPSHRYVSVVSADGPYTGSTPSIIGHPQYAYGGHYQQTLNVETREFVGEPLLLPFRSATERTALGFCWSPDERHIVYFDLKLRIIAVAPTGLPELAASADGRRSDGHGIEPIEYHP